MALQRGLQGTIARGLPIATARLIGQHEHVPGRRSLEQRTADARVILAAVHTDVWVASGSADGQPHLVPLSFSWDGVDIFLAMEPDAVTTRNVLLGGRARLGFGRTRDVVMVDATLREAVPVDEASDDIAAGFARQADWDPRAAGTPFVFVRLRPERIQVWREADEIADRTVMRGGAWLAASS